MPNQFDEPIRILSDLHLAHPGSRITDATQLAPLLEGVRTVIFNGDTSEERLKRLREEAATHIVVLRKLCAEAGITCVMVRGNHDPFTPEIGAVDLCDGKVLVTHGDILYKDVSPWSRNIEFARNARLRIEEDYPADYRQDLESSLEVSRRVTEEMRVHHPKAKPGIIGKLKTLWSQAWPPTRPLTILKVWHQAPELADTLLSGYRPQAKVFIIGHTHRAFVSEKNNRTTINTGAFLTMSKSLAVDVANDTVTVRKIHKKDNQFTLGKTITTIQL